MEQIIRFANHYGTLVAFLAGIVTIASVFSFLWKIYKLFYVEFWVNRKIWREKEIERILYHLLSKNDESDINVLDIIRSNYFINTKVQDTNPEEDDSETNNSFSFIDHLLSKYFINKAPQGKRRFVILGGSGMGKTTFSSGLVVRYLEKYTKRTLPFNIVLLTLGQEFRNAISTIIDPSKTILILDGLDENIEAINDKQKFISELESLTYNFKYVILTCRTQFFDNRDEEPDHVAIVQPAIHKRLAYKNYYLSPLTDTEIKRYLSNKYKVPSNKYSQALKIVEMCTGIMSRPLVLFYVDDLLDLSNQKSLTALEVYKRIIDNWFNRECDTMKVSKTERKNTIESLYVLSKRLSKLIYSKWEETGILSISLQEYNSFIKENENINLRFSFKNRSLLDRDNLDNVKFSHKSFLEFFLAIDAVENPGVKYPTNGFEMAKVFLNDIYKLRDRKFDIIDYYSTTHEHIEFQDIEETTRNAYTRILNTTDEMVCQTIYCQSVILLWNYFIQNLLKVALSSAKEYAQKSLEIDNTDSGKLCNCLVDVHRVNKITDKSRSLINKFQQTFKEINEVRKYCTLEVLLDDLNFINKELLKLQDKYSSIYSFTDLTSTVIINRSFDDIKNEALIQINFIDINCSFSSDGEICSFLNECIRKRPGISYIGLKNTAFNIQELAKFVHRIQSLFLDNDIELSNHNIVVYCGINDYDLTYVINEYTIDNSDSEVYRILEGMEYSLKV